MKASAELKVILRSHLRAQLKVHLPACAGPAAAELCARITASAVWQKARVVMLFYPLSSEPDISPLLAAALDDRKLLTLPRFDVTANLYEPVQVSDLAGELAIGPFQVREPVVACPVVPLNRLDLALVPGLGFDARGHRLGRGKGHYDRLLAGFTGMKIGVAFDFQIVAEVPHEAHDIALDAVVTPTRWIGANAKGT